MLPHQITEGGRNEISLPVAPTLAGGMAPIKISVNPSFLFRPSTSTTEKAYSICAKRNLVLNKLTETADRILMIATIE